MTSSGRVFTGVAPGLVDRLKALGQAEHGVVFDPPDTPACTATTRTPLGECVVAFAYDRDRAELTLTLVRKPLLLPEAMLWDGFGAALERCRREGPA